MNSTTFLAVTLIVFLTLFAPIANVQSLAKSNTATSTHENFLPPHLASIPNHATMKTDQLANEVNVNSLRSSEPAPMGITDYGVGPNGAYSYSTTSFLGIARILSLTTSAPSSQGGPSMGIQLNVVLKFSSNGQQFVYWLQDVANYNTNTNEVYFVDNVWNLTTSTAEMSSSGILGSGKVYTFPSGSTTQSYYAEATSSYYHLYLPAVVQFEITSSINSQNEPSINFEYDYGSGFQTYDTVTFPVPTSASQDSGLVVDGTQYNPYGTFYDAELVMGGEGNGWNTTNVQSNVELQLQFWNGHNYQEVTNAYNFGSDTLEGISNTKSESYYFPINGSLIAQISSGSGSLGNLYFRSQIGIVSIRAPLVSGFLYVKNSSSSTSGRGGTGYSFTGQNVTITLQPGSYTFYIYTSSGTPFNYVTAAVSSGQYLPLQLASSSAIPITLSYSVIGGGTGYSPPTLLYTSNGLKQNATLTNSPMVYYLDSGSSWSVTNTLVGTSSSERWATGQASSGIISSSETTNLLYYHQFLADFNYSIIGGGRGYSQPSVTAFQFGSKTEPALLQRVWIDAGSQYSYTNPLAGSTQSERWQAQNASGQVLSSSIINQEYYHQFVVSAVFSISNNGGTPPTNPAFTSESFGATNSSSLKTTPSSFWTDAGSRYNVSSVVNADRERWITNSSAAGTVNSSKSLSFLYNHQYYLTIQSADQGGGTLSPASGWINAGNSVEISSAASQGWRFEFWTGSGLGSYSGSQSTTTINVQAPIVENATFYVGLTIISTGSGSVSYSYGNVGSSGITTQTVYVPTGTPVTLNANPSSFLYKLVSWSGEGGGSSKTSVIITSPATVQAQFGYNTVLIGGMIAVVVIFVCVVAMLAHRKKKSN